MNAADTWTGGRYPALSTAGVRAYRADTIYYECDNRGVDTRWTVEISEEVAAWYGSLKDADRAYANVALERLADAGRSCGCRIPGR